MIVTIADAERMPGANGEAEIQEQQQQQQPQNPPESDADADEGDEEEETCGFCIFMKGGGCKEAFTVRRAKGVTSTSVHEA